MMELRSRPDEPLIRDEDFQAVANLLKAMTGIHFKSNRSALVAGRLAKQDKLLGLGSIQAYCAYLQRSDNVAEKDAFIAALTTNMTRFNREPGHFRDLSEQVLPKLVDKARRGDRIRIWSAACSTGEEAYDLAFHVLSADAAIAERDVRILATDIDQTALATATTGVYPSNGLDELPKGFIDRFFDAGGAPTGMKRVGRCARDLITFRRLNLNADWPFQGKFDVIMCRNVAIYFDSDTQARLWRRLADRLQPDGTLYLGHSETLPDQVARSLLICGAGTFRRPGHDRRAASGVN